MDIVSLISLALKSMLQSTHTRAITWIYVGISSHMAISVLIQYLTTLLTKDIHPQFVRSDRGVETFSMESTYVGMLLIRRIH